MLSRSLLPSRVYASFNSSLYLVSKEDETENGDLTDAVSLLLVEHKATNAHRSV